MIEFKKAILDEDTVKQLIDLSIKWVEEDCSFGMKANTIEDIMKPCFIAKDGKKIVGYIFGNYYTEKRKRSNVSIGTKCFEIAELYVLPEYRNKGIGRKLFKMMEEEVKDSVEYITLSSSTKDYNRILNFYVNENDMVFHSAYLFKKL